MAKSVINYATRDYQTVLNQINADPQLAEQPLLWKSALAAIFDTLSNVVNAVANAMFPRTAYSRTYAQDLYNTIDYQLRWKQPSTGILTVNIQASATVSGPYTMPASQLAFGTVSSTSKNQIRFESRLPVTFSQGTTQTSVTVYSQTTRPPVVIGVTNGQSWQTIDIPDTDVLQDTLTLTIGADTYTLVTSFTNYNASSTVFRLYFRSDGSCYVKLPGLSYEGTSYGKVPTVGQNVTANYAVGGGAITNTGAGLITQYLGSDSNFVSCTNTLATTGGQDQETLDNAREQAPINLRANGVFMNASSGQAIAQGISGVLTASIVKTGLLTASVYVMPTGGGTPSGALLSTVANTLQNASPLQSIAVSAFGPNYINTSIVAQVKPLSGYAFSDIQKYIMLAIAMRTHELGYYIQQQYLSLGIASAITQINSIFGTGLVPYAFTVDTDGAQITQILSRVTYQQFGRNLYISDLASAIEGPVNGVDYVLFTNPSSTITVPSGGLIHPSSITVTGL